MGRPLAQTQPALAPGESLGVALARIRAMKIDQLRVAWREAFASDPPRALSKDLLARAVAFHAQQEAVGGLPPAAARLLRSLIKPGADPPRQVKVGSIIVREHQGVVKGLFAPATNYGTGEKSPKTGLISARVRRNRRFAFYDPEPMTPEAGDGS